jgi:hypothetical protein
MRGRGWAGVALLTLILVLGVSVTAAAAPRQEQPPGLSVDQAVANVSWNQGWLRPGAVVTFTGAVDAPSTVTATLRPVARPGIVTSHAEFEIGKAGPFTARLRLPPRPLPGVYSLRVGGSTEVAGLKPVDLQVTIPAPPEGVVDRALVGPTKNGPWAVYVGNTGPALHGPHSEIWMRFRFLYPPTGRNVVLVWRLNWHTQLNGRVYKRYKRTIDTFASYGKPLPSGTWNVVLKIDGRVAKQMDVRLSG